MLNTFFFCDFTVTIVLRSFLRPHISFIETESVRYVYQPIEQLFLILITNKSSNILEDIETLRLLAKTVQDGCKNVAVGL